MVLPEQVVLAVGGQRELKHLVDRGRDQPPPCQLARAERDDRHVEPVDGPPRVLIATIEDELESPVAKG